MKIRDITVPKISSSIYLIRGQKVLFDRDLAVLYGVPTKVLIQAVKRNHERFTADFMFQLNWDEAKNSRSQFVTLKRSTRGKNLKYRPYVFTEQGIAMLSSVLRSKTAARVNIAIMRAFVRLREILSTNKQLAYKLDELESKIEKHDERIRDIIQAIRELASSREDRAKRPIGFHA